MSIVADCFLFVCESIDNQFTMTGGVKMAKQEQFELNS